jgi:hypothetical protein
LCAAVIDECLLDRVQLILMGDAFDRCDAGAVNLSDWDETTVNDLAVEYHGARATLALAAAFFRAGEM